MKKVLLNGRLCSVSTISEYTDMVDVCNPKFTAIETDNSVLPIKNKTDEGRSNGKRTSIQFIKWQYENASFQRISNGGFNG